MQKTIKELENYLVLVNYSKATRSAYIRATTSFYKWCIVNKNQPDFDKSQAHRFYLVARSKKGLAWQTVNGGHSAIKMLYTKVLNLEWDVKKTPRPRKGKYLPTVLSQDQIKRLVDHGMMFKHQFFMLPLYVTGLRLSEALNLKLENINPERELWLKKRADWEKVAVSVGRFLEYTYLPVVRVGALSKTLGENHSSAPSFEKRKIPIAMFLGNWLRSTRMYMSLFRS
jgi:site-specific recombinase XerD